MTTTTEKKNVSIVEKSVVDIVTEKIHEFMRSGQLDLPKDYSVENALKSAYLLLNTVKNKDDKPVMVDGKLTGIVTKASIANAILDMIIQGLSPAKDQVYFLVYGITLTAQRSYFGSMVVAGRVNLKVKDWGYGVIYEDDEFSYTTVNGKIAEIKHTQKLENIDKTKIKGVYAEALGENGKPIKSEIMTIEQIHQSWKQSPLKLFDDQGNLKPSSTHAKFPADMALRTVINKIAKFIINASSDNALLLERINRAEDLVDGVVVQMEIEDKANKGSVIMIPEESEKVAQGEPEETKKPEATPDSDLPSPKEEQATLQAKGMVSTEKKRPGF